MSNILKNISKAKFLYIQSSRYAADWHSTLHSHSFTEMFYVVKGRGAFNFRDNSVREIKEDDMVIINPNILHTEVSDPENPLEYIVIGIDGIEFSIDNNDFGFSIQNYKEHKEEVLFNLKLITQEVDNSDEYSEVVIDNLLKTVVINAIRRTAVSINITDDEQEVNNDCIFIENYINVHFREKITLDHLASLTFMNKYYLSHIFKEHTGYAPIEYLLKKRISEAEKLLINTNLSISQISGIVGFGTASYFSQYFKQINDISASAYRKKHQDLTLD